MTVHICLSWGEGPWKIMRLADTGFRILREKLKKRQKNLDFDLAV